VGSANGILLATFPHMFRTHIVGLFLVASYSATAQSGALVVDTPSTDSLVGDVKITTSPKIDALLEDYNTRKHVQKGYRVQIFLGDRKTAEDTKRSFLQQNPDMAAYLSWLAPNFRLRVGDLRTRLEAEHLLREMKVAYPGSYIVPDEIEMPRLDGE